ncbi:MAG: CARDB domain-containing protein [Deltaproteobacteria bacterium]|nr:CARDB domain-containing protein [Deltaproteobacteria bacterium]
MKKRLLISLAFLSFIPIYNLGAECTVTSIAGNGIVSSSGDGRPAVAASLNNPAGLAVDSAGNIYVAEFSGHRIRRIVSSGVINTFAGTGDPFFADLRDGDHADHAHLIYPKYIALDPTGNLFIQEGLYESGWIRKVAASSSIITTVAGGVTNCDGDVERGLNGIEAVSACLLPQNIVINSEGNLYFIDSLNSLGGSEGDHAVIRKIMTDGTVETIAGTGRRGWSGDGGSALSAQIYATDLAFDNNGNLYFASGNYVRKIAPDGIISTVAGNIRGCDSPYATLQDNVPATSASICAHTIAVDSQGNLYIGGVNRVWKVSSSNNMIKRIAGNGTAGFSNGPAREAQFNGIADIASHSDGSIYISDGGNNRIRKIKCKPDLVIESVSILGRGSRLINIRVTIANHGESEARGPFSIGVRPDGYTKPGYNSVQQVLRSGQSLEGGGIVEKTLSLPAAESMEFTIDSGHRVEESNEENNIFPFVSSN